MIHEKFGVVIYRSGYEDKQFSNTTSALQRHALQAIWMKHEKLRKEKSLIHLVESYDYGNNNGIDTSCCTVWL
jgi:hypothetical protein